MIISFGADWTMNEYLVVDCAHERMASDSAWSCAVVSDDWTVCKACKRTLLVRRGGLEVYKSRPEVLADEVPLQGLRPCPRRWPRCSCVIGTPLPVVIQYPRQVDRKKRATERDRERMLRIQGPLMEARGRRTEQST